MLTLGSFIVSIVALGYAADKRRSDKKQRLENFKNEASGLIRELEKEMELTPAFEVESLNNQALIVNLSKQFSQNQILSNRIVILRGKDLPNDKSEAGKIASEIADYFHEIEQKIRNIQSTSDPENTQDVEFVIRNNNKCYHFVIKKINEIKGLLEII